jgi:hypothetical protein|tara:strand:+ start:12 stop:575 length:564 start_codon:yes stop_codon:yes gene_type:complete
MEKFMLNDDQLGFLYECLATEDSDSKSYKKFTSSVLMRGWTVPKKKWSTGICADLENIILRRAAKGIAEIPPYEAIHNLLKRDVHPSYDVWDNCEVAGFKIPQDIIDSVDSSEPTLLTKKAAYTKKRLPSVTSYKVIEEKTSSGLETAVNRYCKAGWEPTGGVSILAGKIGDGANRFYLQAITKRNN